MVLPSELYITIYRNSDECRKYYCYGYKNEIFDVKNKIAHLSKILDWYGSDFGNNNTQILLRIKEFLPKQISESLNANIINWVIDFKSYNWDLNKVN